MSKKLLEDIDKVVNTLNEFLDPEKDEMKTLLLGHAKEIDQNVTDEIN